MLPLVAFLYHDEGLRDLERMVRMDVNKEEICDSEDGDLYQATNTTNDGKPWYEG